MNQNPLSELVHSHLRVNSMLVSSLASKIGFSDIHEGVVRINQALKTLDDKYNLLPLIQQELAINLEIFNSAIEMTKSLQGMQDDKFIPFITIHFKNGVGFHSHKCAVTRINLNPTIVNEPINGQIGIVYQLFREHQIEHDVKSIGFTYHYSSSEHYQLMV